MSAFIIVTGGLFNRYAERIGDLAIKNRLPSMNERSEYVEAGGLMYIQPTMLRVSDAPRITL